jgi:hypothetical protein
MKNWPLACMLLAVWVLIPPLSFAQESDSSEPVPDYEISHEIKLKGVVDEVKDRICPITGGMEWHLMLKTKNKIYEVHIAPVKFAKMYEAAVHKGDTIEIVGLKINFHHLDGILAREIKDGNDDFLFRDEKGKPLW